MAERGGVERVEYAPDTQFVLEFRDDGKVLLWSREAMSGAEFGSLLHEIAMGFINEDIERKG